MPFSLDRKWSRELDRRAVERYGMESIVLMENAGRGVANKLVELGVGAHVVICCGKGNNAGDGFVVARHLDLRRFDVSVFAWGEPSELPADAAANLRILSQSNVPLRFVKSPADEAHFQAELKDAAWIVDALLGTGARGEPRPPLDRVIERINATSAPTMAIDLPSGLDCDTGEPARSTVRAVETCTFVALKRGMLAPAANEFTGRIHVLDIGAPRKLVDEVLVEADRTPNL